MMDTTRNPRNGLTLPQVMSNTNPRMQRIMMSNDISKTDHGPRTTDHRPRTTDHGPPLRQGFGSPERYGGQANLKLRTEN